MAWRKLNRFLEDSGEMVAGGKSCLDKSLLWVQPAWLSVLCTTSEMLNSYSGPKQFSHLADCPVSSQAQLPGPLPGDATSCLPIFVLAVESLNCV